MKASKTNVCKLITNTLTQQISTRKVLNRRHIPNKGHPKTPCKYCRTRPNSYYRYY